MVDNHQQPEPAEAEATEAVRFKADQAAPPAGPGGTPKITIAVSVEIAGEWVEPEMIAQAARSLASSLGARLGQEADQARKEGM
jgi:hypothetical protein